MCELYKDISSNIQEHYRFLSYKYIDTSQKVCILSNYYYIYYFLFY